MIRVIYGLYTDYIWYIYGLSKNMGRIKGEYDLKKTRNQAI